MENPPFSRRTVMTVAAATVSLPLMESALDHLRPAQAAAPSPAATPGAQGGSGPPEAPGFFDTQLRPTDVKDNEFTIVKGHKVLLVRKGDNITAITSTCTHRGCTIVPTAGQSVMTCGCHKAQFNLDGSVMRGPATMPLNHYAVKLNDKGMIEVNPGEIVTKDAKEGVLVSKAPATQPV